MDTKQGGDYKNLVAHESGISIGFISTVGCRLTSLIAYGATSVFDVSRLDVVILGSFLSIQLVRQNWSRN